MLRFLLFLPIAFPLSASETASIAIEVRDDRSAVVTEHFSSIPRDFVYLSSPCARVESGQIPNGAGPWISFAAAGFDISYSVKSTTRECGIPLVMPKVPIESVELTVHASNATISLPHLMPTAPGEWTATLPAIPSKVEVEWQTGAEAARSRSALPTGLFFWNFGGLVVVLICWTVLYLLWARRQTS